MSTAQGAGPDHAVVVVGGGGAGAATVRTLLKSDRDLDITLLTAEPHMPYDRTQLSKAPLLVGGSEDAADPADPPTPKLTLPEGAGTDARLTVRTHAAVTAVDTDARQIVTASGERVDYDRLVLATGSASRRIDLPGVDLPFVHTVRELEGWAQLRASVLGPGPLVIIGGGLIGLEVAAAARQRGLDVTVIEIADRLMARVLPAALTALLIKEHTARGVHIELGTRPVEIITSSGDQPGVVRLADGRTLPAAAVLLSVGAVPRLELAEEAGLVVDDGVVVDDQMRTSDPAVLAAGDIVRVRDSDGVLAPRTQAWTPAVAMGQRAARTVLGDTGAYTDVPWMWSDQGDLRLQTAGSNIAALPLVSRGSLEDPTGIALFGVVDGRVVGVAGMSRGDGIGRTVRAGQMLIAHAAQVDPEVLADAGSDLRRVAADARRG